MIQSHNGVLLRTGDGSPFPDVDLWPSWHAQAACNDQGDNTNLFREVEHECNTAGVRDYTIIDEARTVCASCPVFDQCDRLWRNTESGTRHSRAGMFAGLTPDERAAIDGYRPRRKRGDAA